MRRELGLAAALLLLSLPARADGGSCLSPLHVQGTSLADEAGNPVVLRGVNMGSWLVMETYFTGSSFKDERAVWKKLDERFGPEGSRRIRDAYRGSWITQRDFQRVRALGLNSVRIPFWYGVLEDSGWKWLDKAVDWCEASCLYCIIDLHGAPGGQSVEDHTGASGENKLWGDRKLQRQAAELWTAVAARYRGRAGVAAYDLLNEPMGAPDTPTLVGVYDQLVAAVRAADPRVPVIVEDGYRGLESLPAPSERGWTGVVYSEHQYATFGKKDPKPQDHEDYLRGHFPAVDAQQRRLAAPVYVGEWNIIDEEGGGAAMVGRYVAEYEARGWSWSLWTYKITRNGNQGVWAFYHNDKPIATPDFERDDLPTILAKIDGLRTENLAPLPTLSDGVKPKPKLAGVSALRLVERALPEGLTLPPSPSGR